MTTSRKKPKYSFAIFCSSRNQMKSRRFTRLSSLLGHITHHLAAGPPGRVTGPTRGTGGPGDPLSGGDLKITEK